jgi:hypothetical protein
VNRHDVAHRSANRGHEEGERKVLRETRREPRVRQKALIRIRSIEDTF